MDIFVFLIVFLVACVFVVALPLLSGLGTYKYQNEPKKPKLKKQEEEISEIPPQNFGGYQPVDFSEEDKKAIASGAHRLHLSDIKEKINHLGPEKLPVKFVSSTDEPANALRHRKKIGSGERGRSGGKDVSNFDYDIDELIQEETQQDQLEEEMERREILAEGLHKKNEEIKYEELA